MTTNGVLLSKKLPDLYDSNLDSINISLDTLRPERFRAITGRDCHHLVTRAIEDIGKAGRFNAEVNCVIIRGFNDDEMDDFVGLTENRPLSVRFIEFMPFGGNLWNNSNMVSPAEMRGRIEKSYQLNVLPRCLADTATTARVSGYAGTIGFIASMTSPFCSSCNRVRLTTDGSLKACLYKRERNKFTRFDPHRSFGF